MLSKNILVEKVRREHLSGFCEKVQGSPANLTKQFAATHFFLNNLYFDEKGTSFSAFAKKIFSQKKNVYLVSGKMI